MDNSLMGFELQDLERSESGSERAWPHILSAGNNNDLHIAANSKSHDRASYFLSSLAYPSDVSFALLHQNSRGDTPLHCAARKGEINLVNLFLSNMSDPREKTELLNVRNKQGDTALHLAARNNHFDVVDILMGVDPDLGSMANNSGECPLYVAARKGFLDITERLVESTAIGPGGKTALHAAVLQDHKDVVNFLLAKRPEICRKRDESGSTSLLYAASSGNVKIVQALLDKDDSTVLLADENGLSALHVAAANGDIMVLHQILSRRDDFSELTDNTGRTFLHVAIVKGRVNVLCYVLVRCTLEELLNQPDDKGNTPLHLAVVSRYPRMILLLLADKRVLSDHMNHNGETPLDVVTSVVKSSPLDREMQYNMMKDLVSRGLKFNTQRLDLIPKIQNDPKELKEDMRSMGNNLGIIAVLIATVTFAAGFTLPGGYKSDPGTEQGMATLAKEAAFKVFVISDAIAMMSSIMIILFVASREFLDHYLQIMLMQFQGVLVSLSVRGMMVAFVTGVYVVVSSECLWLAVLICVMAGVVELLLEVILLPRWQIDAILSHFIRFKLSLLRLAVDRAERNFSVLGPKELQLIMAVDKWF